MDDFGDWLEQRDTTFYSLLPMGITKDKDKVNSGIFNIWSLGVNTSKDIWLYSFSKEDLLENIETFEDFFNSELDRWEESDENSKIEEFVRQDPTKIKWGTKDSEIFKLLHKAEPLGIDSSCLRMSLYRPFTKKYLYFSEPLIHRPGQPFPLPRI